jgi:hypothetical protein
MTIPAEQDRCPIKQHVVPSVSYLPLQVVFAASRHVR